MITNLKKFKMCDGLQTAAPALKDVIQKDLKMGPTDQLSVQIKIEYRWPEAPRTGYQKATFSILFMFFTFKETVNLVHFYSALYIPP